MLEWICEESLWVTIVRVFWINFNSVNYKIINLSSCIKKKKILIINFVYILVD